MRIGVFSYDFEHKKSRDGLFNLFLNGYMPECVFAAPKVKLHIDHSKLRLITRGIDYVHPRKVCEKLGIDYNVLPHNDCKELIREYNLDLGIILGARILSEEIIDEFKIGVLNLHPGLLPQNRGLDTIKWAIIEGLEQGAAAHLINRSIDRGALIIQEAVKSYHGDTLVDLQIRVQEKEQDLMIKALGKIERGERGEEIGVGVYHHAMPWDVEQGLI